MQFNKTLSYVFVALLSLSLLTGCGNGSSKNTSAVENNSSQENNATQAEHGENNTTQENNSSQEAESNLTKTKGYLIDSPLQGVTYLCDGEEGLTNAEGMFECVNAPVTFKIGNLTLGTLTAFTADGKVYPQDLLKLARDSYSNSRLKLLARLLQSLDDDGKIKDKISITQSIRDAISKEQNFKDMSANDVSSLLSGLGKTFVEECGAMKHLGDKSVTCNSDGSYYVDTYVPPVVTPTPATQKHNYKVILKTTEKIAGYEVHLKFTDNTSIQSDVVMNNSFLGATGRTVNNLGADINRTTKEIKFGGFTFGNQEGVTGEFDVMTLKSKDSQGEITITKKSCIDKDANDIACDVKIVNN